MNETEKHPAIAWLRRAHSDLALARHAAAATDVLPEDAVYHAQQCAEKALKAMLLERIGQFQLETDGMTLPAMVQRADELTQYAVQTRYPGDWEPISATEMRVKINLAAQILYWADSLIGD